MAFNASAHFDKARVQLPAWSDQWMQGDRFGTIVGVISRGKRKGYIQVLLDKSNRLVAFPEGDLTPV